MSREPGAVHGQFLAKLTGQSPVRERHITIIDYPGEWALDLPLRTMSYADWSRQMLSMARVGVRRKASGPFLDCLTTLKADKPYDQAVAQGVHRAFVEYLEHCRALGLSHLQPGHFLCPSRIGGREELLASEHFWFFPIDPPEGKTTRSSDSFFDTISRRFGAYKSNLVEPFFNSLAGPGVTRQVVLFDLLSAMIGGPEIYNDARRTLTDISAAMEPQTGFFGRLFGPRLKVLYAATKADYVTDGYRADMKAHMEALVPQLRQAGSSRHISQAMALASVAVTKPGKDDRGRAAVYGWVCAEGPAKLDEPAGPRPAFYAFPSVPRHLPTEADWFFWERAGAIGQRLPEFRPPPDFSRGRQDLPHIGLDEAIEFLVGDYV